MLFRVPIAYSAKVVKPRHRKEERVPCCEWIEVEVRETTDAEAPVALRWNESEDGADPSELKETRWFDEGHYMLSDYSDQPLTADMVANMCATATSYENPLVLSVDWHLSDALRKGAKPLAELEVREIVSSGRDEVIEKTLAAAASSLIVDGVFWGNVGEPLYEHVSGYGIMVKHFSEGKGQPPSREDLLKADKRFRADRFDDLADTFRLAHDDWQVRIDVLVPESIRYDDETPALIEAARGAVDSHDGELKGLPKHALNAWVDLRDAHIEASENPTPDAIAVLENTMRTYERTFEDGWAVKMVRKAIKRWDVRPLPTDDNEFRM
jgi:hypothetical protein